MSSNLLLISLLKRVGFRLKAFGRPARIQPLPKWFMGATEDIKIISIKYMYI